MCAFAPCTCDLSLYKVMVAFHQGGRFEVMTNDKSSKPLLRVDEVAAELNVTWVLERRIDSIRVGRIVRISPREVQKILHRGLVPAKPQRSRMEAP